MANPSFAAAAAAGRLSCPQFMEDINIQKVQLYSQVAQATAAVTASHLISCASRLSLQRLVVWVAARRFC